MDTYNLFLWIICCKYILLWLLSLFLEDVKRLTEKWFAWFNMTSNNVCLTFSWQARQLSLINIFPCLQYSLWLWVVENIVLLLIDCNIIFLSRVFVQCLMFFFYTCLTTFVCNRYRNNCFDMNNYFGYYIMFIVWNKKWNFIEQWLSEYLLLWIVDKCDLWKALNLFHVYVFVLKI